MNIGDKIIWRYKDKKTWKRAQVVTQFPNELVELSVERSFEFDLALCNERIIVKLTEIEYEVI